MNEKLNKIIIPDQLNIIIRTNIPGYQKIKYNSSMTIKDSETQEIIFNPLYKLNESIISKIPKEYRIIQFFNKGLFQSLLNFTNASPSKSLKQATYNGNIDNNIKVTLNTIFPINSIINIGGEKYVIGDIQWTNGDWKLEVKQKREEIDLKKITDVTLYNELIKQDIYSGEQQLNEIPKDLLRGNNYVGPPVLNVQSTEEKIEQPNIETKFENQENIQELIVFPKTKQVFQENTETKLYNKELLTNDNNEINNSFPKQKRVENIKDNDITSDNIQKQLLQIENVTEKENRVEEISLEEEKIYDILKDQIKTDIESTNFFRNYFKSNNYYGILNIIYKYLSKDEKNMIKTFYNITTNVDTKENTINLSRVGYNNLIERSSIIKTQPNGNCFFEAVSNGINIHNMQNNDKIIYANYGKREVFTIKIIREIVYRYFDELGIKEKEHLFYLAEIFTKDLNTKFKRQIDGLNLTNEQYIENINSIYNSNDNFLVHKPNIIPLDIDNYDNPFRTLNTYEVENYIKSNDYWANNIAIDAICNILKINIITIERYKSNKDEYKLRIPYLKFDKNILCKNQILFLLYKENHFDLIRFNYNKQLLQKTYSKNKIINTIKYYTIFNVNDMPPPLHILLLIYGSIYINLEKEYKENFLIYKNIMKSFFNSLIIFFKNKDPQLTNVFIKNFVNYFPNSNINLNKLIDGNILQSREINNNDTYMKGGKSSDENSKIAYTITIDMELYPGTSLTDEQIKELKCNSKYNMIRKSYANLVGKPYIISPIYKTRKNKDEKDTKNKMFGGRKSITIKKRIKYKI